MAHHPTRKKRNRTSCQDAFDACLKMGGKVISVGLGPHLARQIQACPGLSLTAYKEPADAQQLDGCVSTTCIIVEADVFDAKSMPRLREIRDSLSHKTDICVVAVTSYMPGAFGEYARLQGADLCVTEEYLSEAVAITTELATMGET